MKDMDELGVHPDVSPDPMATGRADAPREMSDPRTFLGDLRDAVNYHGVDSDLGQPDYVVASRIVSYLYGQPDPEAAKDAEEE